MAAGLHGSARTTPRVRAELQAAQASTRALAALRFGIDVGPRHQHVEIETSSGTRAHGFALGDDDAARERAIDNAEENAERLEAERDRS
jgi:hypothetical protein